MCSLKKLCFVVLRNINSVSNHFVSREHSRTIMIEIEAEILRWTFLNMSGTAEIFFDFTDLSQINLTHNFRSFFFDSISWMSSGVHDIR